MSNGYLTGCALIISAIITIIFLVRKNIGNFEKKILFDLSKKRTKSQGSVVMLKLRIRPIFFSHKSLPEEEKPKIFLASVAMQKP